jgi:hypothetical protein
MRKLLGWAFAFSCSLALLGCTSTRERLKSDGYFDDYIVTLDAQAALQEKPTVLRGFER